MASSSHSPLIADLLQPAAYPHPVTAIAMRETHISWVLLTGELAYKIKKPVDLGFVDFTTLERRRHFCEEEVRLNRRYAAELYLGVVPITRRDDGFRIDGAGEPVEYAVRMRQFDDRQLASLLLEQGKLTASQMDDLAAVVASLHDTAERVGEREWGTSASVKEPVVENFAELRPLIDDPPRIRQLQEIERWSLNAHDELAAKFDRRRRDGFVRECHGDLHLGNIVLWHGALRAFDCIEFEPSFRWIDVINEVAFLVMDLDDHGRSDLAWRFLNAYLEQTGDYAGLSVLPFYLVYRAVVRAKIDALRRQQTGLAADEQQQLTDASHGYIDLAARYTQRQTPMLAITHGFSGSGKTTGTQSLLQQRGAIRVRSDVERKRLFGLTATEDATAAVESGIYSENATQRTYDRLAALAGEVIRVGYPVFVDATFLKRSQRHRFRQLADDLNVPFHIIAFEADAEELKERIRRRQSAGGDASDATSDVLEHQLQTYEPLTPDERRSTV